MTGIKTFSPKELAGAIGVSESTVKRWIDDGQIEAARTAGGHRRIPLHEAIRFIRRTDTAVLHPEVLGLPESRRGAGEAWLGEGNDEPLYEALLRGDAARARALVLTAYMTGQSVPALLDGPIRAAMHRVGELWKHQRNGILVEHRATEICLQIVQQLRLLLPPPAPGALAAIGCGPAGDPYLLPSLMAATTLVDAGLHATNLGADLPMDSLAIAADLHDPSIVWLSVSIPSPPAGFAEELRRLATRVGRRQTSVVIGGRGASEKLLLDQPANVHAIHSMTELAAFARGKTAASTKLVARQ